MVITVRNLGSLDGTYIYELVVNGVVIATGDRKDVEQELRDTYIEEVFDSLLTG